VIDIQIEADTLKSHTGNLQSACSVELPSFIVILRSGVLSTGQCFLYERRSSL
jgi:hypothetical protein